MDDEATALPAAVARALGRDVSRLADIRRIPLDYDAFLAHRTVSRLEGTAVVDGEPTPWSLIEKRTEGPPLASDYLLANGRRELEAYRSGLLDDLAPGLGAPRAYGTLLDLDGGITLWLEEVRHEGRRPLDASDLLAAAHDLGRLAGRWTARDLTEPWYFTGWIDRHSQPEAVVAGLATVRGADARVGARIGGWLPLVERLILGQSSIRKVLEQLTHTLCHHDAVGANLFRSEGRTVLIDWESVGPGPIGADLASLVFSSVRRGDASIHTVMPILNDLVQSYADGLREEVPSITMPDVRRGFDASAALRWKLAADVIRGIQSGDYWRRGSLPDEPPEDALDELILLVDLILASAGRALD